MALILHYFMYDVVVKELNNCYFYLGFKIYF